MRVRGVRLQNLYERAKKKIYGLSKKGVALVTATALMAVAYGLKPRKAEAYCLNYLSHTLVCNDEFCVEKNILILYPSDNYEEISIYIGEEEAGNIRPGPILWSYNTDISFKGNDPDKPTILTLYISRLNPDEILAAIFQILYFYPRESPEGEVIRKSRDVIGCTIEGEQVYLGEFNGLATQPHEPSQPVPEPATVMLAGLGLTGISFMTRKKISKKQQKQ